MSIRFGVNFCVHLRFFFCVHLRLKKIIKQNKTARHPTDKMFLRIKINIDLNL